jgi:hypothetical protein
MSPREARGHYKARLEAYLDDELTLIRALRDGDRDQALEVVEGLADRGRILRHLEGRVGAALGDAPAPGGEPVGERVDDTIHLTIPDDAWGLAGPNYDRAARLRLTLSIGDCSLHLEAWALMPQDEEAGGDPDRLQELADRADSLDHLANAVGARGPFETHEIAGREYVLVATPYCT